MPAHPLTVDGLTRALALLIDQRDPLTHGARIGSWVSTRARTRRDYRRLVFQSLAEPNPAAYPEEVEGGNDASLDDDLREDLLHTGGVSCSYLIDTSDETPDTTDILDALTVTQPDYEEPGIIHVPRAAFQSVASAIPRSTVHLNKLHLPRSKLLALLKVLLAIRPDGPGPDAGQYATHTGELETVADCLLLAFAVESTELISWKSFNRTLVRSMVTSLPFKLQRWIL